MDPLHLLKDKLGKRNKPKVTGLTTIIDFIRELKCLDAITGRTFEVYDPNGKLVYTVKQKPLKISQLILLIKELEISVKREAHMQEQAMKKGKGKSNLASKRKK